MQVKICGLTETDSIKACIDNKADYCGFILNYPKSHRFINYDKAVELTNTPKSGTKYVGVLVSPTENELEKFSKLNLDYFQIYGNYDKKNLQNIRSKYKKKIIMALQIKSKKDVFKYKTFEEVSDIILWDSSGLERSLSWNFEWIKSVPKHIIKMVAGNIDINKLEMISKLADIVDVSGALEVNKVKDITKIKSFLNKIQKINDQN
tara:strand:- start:445 stop:1062 length:618 start_codon:yes stop_codon:yes gene_type:complete